MIRKRFLAIVVLISNVCMAQTFIAKECDENVNVEYIDGQQWAYKEIEDIVVGLSCKFVKDDYGKFYLIDMLVYNCGESPAFFDPNEVYANLINKRGDTLQLKVYTNETFRKKIKRQQNWSIFLNGISSGLNSGSAGHSTSYSSSYSSNGDFYNTVTHHYNSNAAFVARINAYNQMKTLEKTLDNERLEREIGYMKKNTIHQDKSVSGYMNIKYKKGKILTVNVSVRGKMYSFDWDVSRKK